MANFNKAFNFRGGFQVDTDILVVRGQNVGIGSSIPGERLVVDGKIQAESLGVNSISIQRSQVGILTVSEYVDIGVEKGSNQPYPLGSPQVRISTGIITAANPAIGFVTYYGDGGKLLNLPTSQWVDTDVGLGFTSIYAAGNVGVGTTDPRFVFQVGANPLDGVGFNTTQSGFAVESGTIIATNDIRIGGDIQIDGGISIGGTSSSSLDGDLVVGGSVSIGSTLYVAGIVTAQELAGIGSLITLINADNIAIGSIGSMRYGDIINTKEVYADRFIGTATSAEDLASDAQISIDTINANGIGATTLVVTDRVTSLGTLTVGHNDTGVVGDIDLRKTDSDATIYSLTDSAFTARVFVGHEREESSNNGFGGIRFGGNAASSPLSGANDLDLVNFDVGNVNFYLHEGNPAGGTTGSFRWINGQLDLVIAELTNDGGFILPGNGNPLLPTFEVSSGFSTFKGAATFDTTVDVVGNATFGGNVNVGGELSFGSILFEGQVQVPSLLVDTSILLGTDPTSGGTGVLISSNGSINASNSFNVGSSVIASSGINVSNLTATNASIGDLTATSIDADTISNGNYTISSNGNATFGTLTAASVVVPNLTAPTATFTQLDTDILNAQTGSFITEVVTPTISGLTSLTISGDIAASTSTIGVLNSNNITVTGPSNLTDLTVSGATTLSSLSVTNQVNFGSASITSLATNQITALKYVITPNPEYIAFERNGTDLRIRCFDGNDVLIGTATLPLS